MKYVVSSCTLRNHKSIGVGVNSFHDFISSKPFPYKGFVVSSLDLKVLSVNKNPIVNVEVSGFSNMKGVSPVVDSIEEPVDVVAYCSHS